MSGGDWIGIGLGILALVGTLITALLGRRATKEANGIDRFEAAFAAQDKRIADLERQVRDQQTQIKDQDKKISDQAEELEKVAKRYASVSAQLTRIKRVVQDWFEVLRIAWAKHDDEHPMPMPSEEDMALLEITIVP